MDADLETFFPARFDSAAMKEYYSQLKSRTLTILDGIVKDEDFRQQVDEIDWMMIQLSRPVSFSGVENAEIEHIRTFEQLSYMISTDSSLNPKLMTVIEFFNALETIKKKLKNGRKSNKSK